MKQSRSKIGMLGLSTTKPGSILKKHIQVRNNQWNETKPGFLEADTVAYCGTSIGGPIEKKYDFPKTPYQPLLESACITKTEKQARTEPYRNLTPFALSATVNCEVKQFLAQTRPIQLDLDINFVA